MADREKLIELIAKFCGGLAINDVTPPYGYENLADHLISHGVTVRERGRWIEVDDGVLIGQGKHHECSRCGTWTTPWRMSNYCPYCGCDMRGEEDG